MAATDDELGTAPADVDNQSLFVAGWQPVDDTLIDQASLLTTRYHFDWMPQRGFRRQQKGLRVAQLANRVGRDGTHVAWIQAGQPLAELGQTFECHFAAFRGQRTILAQAGRQADAFAQAIDDAQFTVRIAGHDQMKAV